MTNPDQELVEILTGAAHEIGCDETQTRDHLRHIFKEEPCDAPDCTFCPKPEKRRMLNIDRLWTITKIAALFVAFAVVVALAFAMVFGQDLP